MVWLPFSSMTASMLKMSSPPKILLHSSVASVEPGVMMMTISYANERGRHRERERESVPAQSW
jgi:hypothetical protein